MSGDEVILDGLWRARPPRPTAHDRGCPASEASTQAPLRSRSFLPIGYRIWLDL